MRFSPGLVLPSAVLLGFVLYAGAAAAYPGQGVPNPRYPDGTGDDAIATLNDAQLDQNYRGPTYQGGPPPGAPRWSAPPPPPPPYPPAQYRPYRMPPPPPPY